MRHPLHGSRRVSLCLILFARATAPAAPAEAVGADDHVRDSWVLTSTLNLSGGYRDNVLLSSVDPAGSGYGRVEFDMSAFRRFGEALTWVAFFQGDYRRFVAPPPEMSAEQLYSLHGEARWQARPNVLLRAVQQGYYQDLVLDVSSTESGRLIAPLRTVGSLTSGRAEVGLPGGLTLAPSVQFHLSDFHGYAGDYEEVKSNLRLDWSRARWLSLAVEGQQRDRTYADRLQFTAGGRPLPDTTLEYRLQRLEARASTAWTWQGDWHANFRGGRETVRDNGSGFFDHDRRAAEASLTWSPGGWTVHLAHERARDTYRVQTVGIGIDPPRRRSDARAWSGRLTYAWSPTCSVFAEAQDETLASNEPEFSYAVTTAGAGISFHY